ncbi:hypothetical protein REC12_15880 [Desulfosporosinus sp. PR]|uniref:hypothetical protein n=1 Tax=Candidatus Desulfosporosinus nitrosoreducens TaxID=3401928 RepID=UPI0027EFDB2D|nr:hypothetical protein [Desulfosporosinus sp. PR]MDQ7095076.1 hypothetical protein [Desulfosporosinus sp. PR]
MAVIVVHRVTGQYYALVGTGYSFYKDSRPSFLGGVLFPHQEEGEFKGAAIADEQGSISWVHTSELKVIEVDGIKVGELLSPYADMNSKTGLLGEFCSFCGAGVSEQEKVCPFCKSRLRESD